MRTGRDAVSASAISCRIMGPAGGAAPASLGALRGAAYGPLLKARPWSGLLLLKVKVLRISDLPLTGDLVIAVDVIVGSPVLDAPGVAEGT
jgi:hypothetical protein